MSTSDAEKSPHPDDTGEPDEIVDAIFERIMADEFGAAPADDADLRGFARAVAVGLAVNDPAREEGYEPEAFLSSGVALAERPPPGAAVPANTVPIDIAEGDTLAYRDADDDFLQAAYFEVDRDGALVNGLTIQVNRQAVVMGVGDVDELLRYIYAVREYGRRRLEEEGQHG